eukprot:TRINITY_DN2581_c0_g1_i6.p1 TRINITY_DN2581_c0_g1~~TRINITY_DN2581_c0_g1_i6.p1  ORF type:complete len:310 (-),score=30.73 TRINITY_DN2581_c0_g1_i6:376-1305(-)
MKRKKSTTESLFNAIQNNQIGKVAGLLKTGSDPNAIKESSGHSCLFLACALGHHECAELLIEHDADVHWAVPMSSRTTITNSWTPLLISIKNQCVECVEVLLKVKADPNTRLIPKCTNNLIYSPTRFDFCTALQIALDCVDNTKIISLLLEHGADPNDRVKPHSKFKGIQQLSTLQKCRVLKHEMLIINSPKYVFSHKEKEYKMVVTNAFKEENFDVITRLIELGLNIDSDIVFGDVSLLGKALSSYSLPCVEYLIKQGANLVIPVTRGKNKPVPFQLAIESNDIDKGNIESAACSFFGYLFVVFVAVC